MFNRLKRAAVSAGAALLTTSTEEQLATSWREKRDRVLVELDQAKARLQQLIAEAASHPDRDAPAIRDARVGVGALQDRLEVLEQTLAVAEQRAQAERDRAATQRERETWVAFERALADRQKAFEAMVKQSQALAKSLAEAEAAAVRAFHLMPVKDSQSLPTYLKLEGEMLRQLAYASDFKYGAWKGDYSEGYEHRKKANFLGDVDQDARSMLAQSPFAADDKAA